MWHILYHSNQYALPREKALIAPSWPVTYIFQGLKIPTTNFVIIFHTPTHLCATMNYV